MMNKDGKMIILSAPSGSGKSTIIKHLMDKGFDLAFSVSATNRPIRKGEQEGHDYYYLSTEEFRERIDRGDFVEWEEVYPGRYYGTLKSEVERVLNSGRKLIFDIDIAGGLNIKKLYQDRALALFIMPPSVMELRRRLEKRDADTPQEIDQRVAKAEAEMQAAPKFDRVIVNDRLTDALTEAEEIVSEFLNKQG